MTLTFDARIDGPLIRCRIGSDTDLAAPVFCFSLMAPGEVVSGGEMIRSLAGYCELRLRDITAGEPVEVVLRHRNRDFSPTNRAWLPLGPYLRLSDGTCAALPDLPAGVTPVAPTPAPPCDGLRIVPQPTGWVPSGGSLPVPTLACADEAFAAVDALAARTGLGPFLDAQGLPVTLDHDPALPAEGYRLTISPGGIAVAAPDRAGRVHAAITLLSLMATHDRALPCGTITDAPRFAWRGQHLDCARHFFAPDSIARLMDLMALLKLNRFHWHFADDEAFRLQVTTAPELWQGTEWRGEGCAVPGVFGGGIRSGGSYSRADVDRLVAHGRALNIEILPEIEVPGHAFAMNAVIPGLRDPGDIGQEASIQGYTRNAINPALPATWALIEPLAKEVAAMFPLGMLHLGCDELAPDTWAGSPAVNELRAREGLAGRDDVQGWMMARLAGHLTANGIRTAAWEEAAKGANGGIGHGALLFSWTGQGPGVAAARAGHDVVMCPAQHVYLDMAHTGDPADWGASWAAFVALEDSIDWDPVPDDAPDIADRVVGVQGTFWSEFTTSDDQLQPMLAPRILGVATKAWDRGGSRDGARLRALAGAYRGIFDAMGWRWHGGA